MVDLLSGNESDDEENETVAEPGDNVYEQERHVIVTEVLDKSRAFDSDEEKQQYVIEALREWALRGVSKKKVDELLALLKPVFTFLPVSYKTLLKTPRKHSNLEKDEQGLSSFWYYGILPNILARLTPEYFDCHNEIVIDINIDGLTLYHSAATDFWTILGNFKDTSQPFIIAVYCGEGKPSDVEKFLDLFVKEVDDLQQNGVHLKGSGSYPFRVGDYILDAPARAFVKCIVGHNGTCGCEKCTATASKYKCRMTYDVEDNSELRSDESFKSRMQRQHHNANYLNQLSPLERINTGMVSQFRLDSMHLVYQGVFKRFIDFLFDGQMRYKLSLDEIHSINQYLKGLTHHFPSEFNRPPKPITKKQSRKPRYKATEYRRLMFYDGLFIFKKVFRQQIYRLYLLLHCGLYILASPSLYLQFNEVADFILRTFVKQSKSLFGQEFIT